MPLAAPELPESVSEGLKAAVFAILRKQPKLADFLGLIVADDFSYEVLAHGKVFKNEDGAAIPSQPSEDMDVVPASFEAYTDVQVVFINELKKVRGFDIPVFTIRVWNVA